MEDFADYFGSPNYMLVSYLLSMFFLLLCLLAIKKFVRIMGMESWLVVAIFGPAPLLLALPVVILTNIPSDYSVPVAVTAFLLTIPMMHWILPRFAADFQAENFGASMMLSLMIGIGVLMSATFTGQTPSGLFPPDAFSIPEEGDYSPNETPGYLKDGFQK